MVQWTPAQHKRLKELNAGARELALGFADARARDAAFQDLEGSLAQARRRELDAFRREDRRSGLALLENRLSVLLAAAGFCQVMTPIIMSAGHLARMSITPDHPLSRQIYWIDGNRCLRPMLAPHLYYVLQDLLRLWERPVRIFEVGPCFRKEGDGARHAGEFTMLNLVEMGLEPALRKDRIQDLARMVTTAAGISDCRIQAETSEVYGDTLDVVTADGELELASCAMGPHPLDRAWRIDETWVGIGFGLERLLMASSGAAGLKSVGRSLTYLNGIRLNL